MKRFLSLSLIFVLMLALNLSMPILQDWVANNS